MKALGHLERVRGVDTSGMSDGDFVSTFPPAEAASAVSGIGCDDEPHALTVTTWMRIKRRLRALVIKRMKP